MELREDKPNPLVHIIAVFQDGAALRFSISPPVQQSQFMLDIGRLLDAWGVEFNVELPAEVIDA